MKAVDAGALTVTNKAGAKTYAVAPDAAIMIDGRPGKLADVPIQAHVTLNLSDDEKNALSVQVQGPHVPGLVKAVDADKNTITVANKLGEKSYDVARNLSVNIDGKPSKLADLSVDVQVTLSLSADQKTARAIHAEGPQITGVVKGVDGAANVVTVADKRGEKTFTLAKNAKVMLDEVKEGKLADLIDGTIVSARLSIGKNEITGVVRAAGPSFQGIVKAVDVENQTITITIRGKGTDAAEKTFKMTKDTQIMTAIYGVALTVADLKNEKEVILRLSTDQKAAVRIAVLGL